MTVAGAVILFICFLGPILPPIIGMVVGGVFDIFRRKRETADVAARRRIATDADQGPQPLRADPASS